MGAGGQAGGRWGYLFGTKRMAEGGGSSKRDKYNQPANLLVSWHLPSCHMCFLDGNVLPTLTSHPSAYL